MAGSTSAMITSLRNNSRLLKKRRMFSNKKPTEPNNTTYNTISLSSHELKKLRIETKNKIKKDRKNRIIIGLFVIVPFCIFMFGMVYLILERMFL